MFKNLSKCEEICPSVWKKIFSTHLDKFLNTFFLLFINNQWEFSNKISVWKKIWTNILPMEKTRTIWKSYMYLEKEAVKKSCFIFCNFQCETVTNKHSCQTKYGILPLSCKAFLYILKFFDYLRFRLSAYNLYQISIFDLISVTTYI